MKTKESKSPEETEVTPNRKKLKQARLPFKLISDVSPSPLPLPSRKRKLTSPVTETASKLGKLSKENGVTDELIILCDDDSKDAEQPQKDQKILNPYVKLVDTVLKKKLQTSPKQKHRKKNKSHSCKEESTASGDYKRTDDVELMDVDTPDMPDDSKKQDEGNNTHNENDISKEILVNDQNSSNDVVVLEDSNNPFDIKNPKTDNMKDQNVSETSDTKESPEINKGVTTPKRSARIKANVDEQNALNSSSAQLDESLSTPKRNKNSPTDKLDESLNETASESNNMTPKQLQKKLDSAKKKEEREKERLDREKKRQQEKDDRAKQKQEKEEQRKKERLEKEEIKRKEREEKEELRRKEKEEKDRQKELEKKLREEKEEQKRKEREEKEEQKRKEKEAREEERRKKQEAVELEKQEQELKKKKAAEAFVNFFVPKQKVESEVNNKGLVSKNSMLSSFTVKADMRLAPLVRAELTEDNRNNLDSNIENQELSESNLYLKSLKSGTIIPMSSGKTWPLSDKDDDVMIIEDELLPIDSTGEIMTCETVVQEKLKPKLLSFHENRRPPYWGTWRKKSKWVKARKPFGQEKQLDYEVDSDEEWEEEQEGESIDGSAAGSDDEQELDEYEVDNEVFVPHGYLSDEEATMDEDDVLSLSPETQKAKLKQLEDEFESELKKPTEKLKPRLYGLLWETNEGGKPDNCVDALWNYFGKLSMIINDPTPHLQPSNNIEETEKKKKHTKKKRVVGEEDSKSPKVEKNKKVKSEEGIKKKDKKMPQQQELNKNVTEVKNTQPAINSFLAKLKSQH